MATPPQLVQMAFAAGLDESQQDEVLDPATGFPVLQNARQDKRGGLSKRLGYAALTKARLDATTRSAGSRLFCHGEVVCTLDGTHLDAYASGAAVSAVASRVPEASVTTRTLTNVVTNGAIYDIALCNGYVATAALRTIDVLVGVETTTGVVVRPAEIVFTSSVTETVAQLVTYSTYIILVVFDSSTANVKAYYLDTTSAATITTGWVSIGNVATNKTTSGIAALALSAQSLSNRVAFAYVNNSGGTSQVTVKTMTVSGVTETATVNTASATPDCVAVEGSIADTLWVAWNQTVSIRLVGLDADSLASTLATTATIITLGVAPSLGGIHIVSSSTAGRGRLVVNDGNGVNLRARGFQTTAGAAATDGSQVTLYGVSINARPFMLNSRFYGLFRSGDSTSGVTVLCDFTDLETRLWLRPVAMAFPGLTQSIGLRGLHHVALTATSMAYAVPVRRSSVGDSAELITYDFADRKRWRSVSYNGSLYLSGGILSYFDGRRVAEVGFLHAPKKPTATDATTGSGPDGTYKYVATFEEMDDDGNWCVSGVSSPSDTLSISDNTATVTTYPLTITNRLTATTDKRVRVAFYRTLTGAEPPYYFVSSIENVTNVAATLSDSSADETIASNRLLCGTGNLPGTNGSGQDRRAPPYCQDVVGANGMLVLASGPDLLWSFAAVSGEGAAFNPIFAVPVDSDGNVTAVSFQDGTFFAFKRRSIFAVAGEAPSDNGSSGGLGTPRRLAVDVGCIDPCSVVVTSLGIFFQSERGIELLGRSGAVTWIGEQVQSTLASFPVVSSAVLDDRNGLVRFSLATTTSSGRVSGNGRDLVYDLSLEAWQSVDDKTGASSHEASQDAAMLYVTGSWRYGWLGTDGTVYYERLSNDASAHLDVSTWVTMAAETAWFKASGIQGKQHLNTVLTLMRKSTDLNLSASLSYNYETSFRTARTWTRTEINGLLTDGWPVTQLKHDAHDDAECQSVRIRLADATPTGGTVGSGKGATWIALTLDITPKPGVFDVPEEAA